MARRELYRESGKNYKNRRALEFSFGVEGFFVDQVLKVKNDTRKPQYALPECDERAIIARGIYEQFSSKTKGLLYGYEKKRIQLEAGKKKIEIPQREGRCKICSHSNMGIYGICPVCIDVYLNEYRDKFFKSISSCTALKLMEA
jgi:hypothetical protein